MIQQTVKRVLEKGITKRDEDIILDYCFKDGADRPLVNTMIFYFVLDWKYVFQVNHKLTVYDIIQGQVNNPSTRIKYFDIFHEYFKTGGGDKDDLKEIYSRLGNLLKKLNKYENKTRRHFKEFLYHLYQYFHNDDYASKNFPEDNRWVRFNDIEINHRCFVSLNKLYNVLKYNQFFYENYWKIEYNGYTLSKYFITHVLLRHMTVFKIYSRMQNKIDSRNLVALNSTDGTFPKLEPFEIFEIIEYITKKIKSYSINYGTTFIYVDDLQLQEYLNGNNEKIFQNDEDNNILNYIICVEIEKESPKVLQTMYPLNNDIQLVSTDCDIILSKVLNQCDLPQ